ncbi:YwpF family protein [uncultured Metabacillus sp.]|uniref:YwpF family protein n=1 Tax=uncultured Metabacillus sp. TaxID=2860135 RepID=UPI002631DC92|nr:YwpF family protein [uncultured Metabacillus sp.]
MKTFKLVGLKIEQDMVQEKTIKEIPLEDGLIINLEDGENSWLIEALIPEEFQTYFEKLSEAKKKMKVLVTISKKTNAPAQIMAKVKTITPLENHLSILLDGRLLTSRPIHDPEQLLRSLMGQGLSGDALIKTFSENVHQRKESTKL